MGCYVPLGSAGVERMIVCVSHSIIGRAGASPPSRATGLNFLYNIIYIYF